MVMVMTSMMVMFDGCGDHGVRDGDGDDDDDDDDIDVDGGGVDGDGDGGGVRFCDESTAETIPCRLPSSPRATPST